MNEKLAKLLEELSLLNGLPGQEQPVTRYLRDAFAPFADEVQIGVNGNIYARKKGKKPGMTVAVSAHIDEIGCVVRDIDPSGMIRFDKLGWFSDSWLPGTRVQVGKIQGMVGIKSGHLMTEEEKRTVLPHRSLYIDVGAAAWASAPSVGGRLRRCCGLICITQRPCWNNRTSATLSFASFLTQKICVTIRPFQRGLLDFVYCEETRMPASGSFTYRLKAGGLARNSTGPR